MGGGGTRGTCMSLETLTIFREWICWTNGSRGRMQHRNAGDRQYPGRGGSEGGANMLIRVLQR